MSSQDIDEVIVFTHHQGVQCQDGGVFIGPYISGDEPDLGAMVGLFSMAIDGTPIPISIRSCAVGKRSSALMSGLPKGCIRSLAPKPACSAKPPARTASEP